MNIKVILKDGTRELIPYAVWRGYWAARKKDILVYMKSTKLQPKTYRGPKKES